MKEYMIKFEHISEILEENVLDEIFIVDKETYIKVKDFIRTNKFRRNFRNRSE
jgi:hypothetical protein